MKTSQHDRRIERTRRLLRTALMDLILEKGYDSITVEDITARADLGRTTFYLHYKDKEELLLKSLEAVAAELLEQIDSQRDGDGHYHAPGGAIRIVFQHASENADLYHIILNGGAAVKALEQLHEVIAVTAARFIHDHLHESELQLDVPVEVLAAYFATSLLGFLTWWLRRGMPEGLQEITEIYVRLVMGGMAGVLGE